MLKIYPRNFIGPSTPDSTALEPSSYKQGINVVRNSITISQVEIQKKPGHDKEVEALYQEFLNNQDLLMKFDFRERILIKAKQLLTLDSEIKDFKSFLFYQLKSPEFNKNHLNALFEIINFIRTGKLGLRLLSWVAILDYEKSTKPLNKEEKEAALKRITELKDDTFKDINLTLTEWCSRPSGYGHLLFSLFLLYGSKVPNPWRDE